MTKSDHCLMYYTKIDFSIDITWCSKDVTKIDFSMDIIWCSKNVDNTSILHMRMFDQIL